MERVPSLWPQCKPFAQQTLAETVAVPGLRARYRDDNATCCRQDRSEAQRCEEIAACCREDSCQDALFEETIEGNEVDAPGTYWQAPIVLSGLDVPAEFSNVKLSSGAGGLDVRSTCQEIADPLSDLDDFLQEFNDPVPLEQGDTFSWLPAVPALTGLSRLPVYDGKHNVPRGLAPAWGPGAKAAAASLPAVRGEPLLSNSHQARRGAEAYVVQGDRGDAPLGLDSASNPRESPRPAPSFGSRSSSCGRQSQASADGACASERRTPASSCSPPRVHFERQPDAPGASTEHLASGRLSASRSQERLGHQLNATLAGASVLGAAPNPNVAPRSLSRHSSDLTPRMGSRRLAAHQMVGRASEAEAAAGPPVFLAPPAAKVTPKQEPACICFAWLLNAVRGNSRSLSSRRHGGEKEASNIKGSELVIHESPIFELL